MKPAERTSFKFRSLLSLQWSRQEGGIPSLMLAQFTEVYTRNPEADLKPSLKIFQLKHKLLRFVQGKPERTESALVRASATYCQKQAGGKLYLEFSNHKGLLNFFPTELGYSHEYQHDSFQIHKVKFMALFSTN